MPHQIAGLNSDGSFASDETFAMILTYGSGPITFDGPTASPVIQISVINQLTPEEAAVSMGPGGMLITMFALTEACAPETVQSEPAMDMEKWLTASGQTMWFSCEIGMVQDQGELAGAQRRHLAGWAGPRNVAYLVDAPTQKAREEAVAALVNAAATS